MLPKDCGPFHPDYAIAWSSDDEENYLMICYTCFEAKLIRGGKDRYLRGLLELAGRFSPSFNPRGPKAIVGQSGQ